MPVALLQRAGFALPVVDVDRITVTYGDPLRLMRELGRMGEANALLRRRLRAAAARPTLARGLTIYQEQFGDAEGRVPATFDILFMAGWKPDPSQQQPARRGSGPSSGWPKRCGCRGRGDPARPDGRRLRTAG